MVDEPTIVKPFFREPICIWHNLSLKSPEQENTEKQENRLQKFADDTRITKGDLITVFSHGCKKKSCRACFEQESTAFKEAYGYQQR